MLPGGVVVLLLIVGATARSSKSKRQKKRWWPAAAASVAAGLGTVSPSAKGRPRRRATTRHARQSVAIAEDSPPRRARE